MSNKYKLKGANGKFFVNGAGFSAASATDGSVLTESNLACLADLGFTGTKVNAISSYAVVYIRGKDVTGSGTLNKQTPNAANGEVDPSKRRFLTEDEAWQHGTRARERRKNQGDKPGTAGHRGFFVISTTDPVNSVINWKTGLTNPSK